MLGVLLRLALVEQRHDLPHHDVHRIVAHLLGDRDELDAVLHQPTDVELQLELIAEEPAERVDDDHVERRGLARARARAIGSARFRRTVSSMSQSIGRSGTPWNDRQHVPAGPTRQPTRRPAMLSQFRQPFDEPLLAGMAVAYLLKATDEVLGRAFFLGYRPKTEE